MEMYMTETFLIKNLNSNHTDARHIQALMFVLENDCSVDAKLLASISLSEMHSIYNNLIKSAGLDESCLVNPTDSVKTIRKKCKKAFKHGVYYYPMLMTYAVSKQDGSDSTDTSANPSGNVAERESVAEVGGYYPSGFTGAYKRNLPIVKKPLLFRMADIESGLKKNNDDYDMNEADSSTERVRRYYKRHPEKVRKYLRDTVKDRVARNRDRAKAIKTHGKTKMKNHDVHHPNGAQNGNWRLAKKDHGRDKKNESVDILENAFNDTVVCAKCLWRWNIADGGENKYLCHRCWHDNTPTYLSEGGAAGHLAHPFEDEELTFSDMKEMITRGLLGGLDAEAPVTEKLDGQNIAFSVRDGQIVFARNKGHVKARGKNALDVAGIRQMFAGRGNIEKAFTGAAEDLQAAVQKLSPEQIQQMFGNGSKFMSLEVILPDTQNVIPYGKSVLVMHGSIEYDEDGNEIGRSTTDGKEFADAVTAVGADQQKTYGISGPKTIAFSDADTEKYQQKAEEYLARLDRMAQEFDLNDKSTLAEYRRAWWERELTQQIESNGLDLSEREFDGLIERWADGSKKFGVKDIENDEVKKWFREFEKNELAKKQKAMIKPVETTFLQAGADSLRRVTNFLSSNNPEASVQLKRDVLDAIKAIRDSNQPDKIAKLQKELERLESIGMDSVVPSEGVVFIYNGKPYKFTGQFAPINQITGTFKFGMAPKETEEPAEEVPTASEPTPKEPTASRRTIAIFTGRFQPFHAGHYSIYQEMVKRFGKENVYIASSDKTDAIKSPFNFNQKKQIMSRMFDIPEDMIVQVKNPYAPVEILEKQPENTTYVTAVSQKDADRLAKGGKYFKNFDDVEEKDRKGFKDQGYFIVAPEMQLTVNGKNISGTQLRAVMGDPKITDRAKQEIFTKVYGKFDTEIFKKIVKITTDSEQALQLTQTHGAKKEARPRKTAASKRAVDRARSVLKQKVNNPETKRDIYVATALGYDKQHPARIAAEKIVNAAMQGNKNESLMVENIDTKKLQVYVYVRDYTDDELKNEVGEYFENEETKKMFSNLADTPEELTSLIKNAPAEVLSRKELIALQNSDVSDVLKGKTPAKVLHTIQTKYSKDVKSLLNAVKEEKELPMPIVIRHSNGYYLLGGNTRLSVLASMNYTMPVKVLHASKNNKFHAAKTNNAGRAQKRKMSSKELFNKLLQMKVNNPETGNLIKVDTAMDYDKNHPAHKAALNLIRQHMQGISNRAGIPKNRKK